MNYFTPHRDSTWTDERVAELKRLHISGMSASEVARALGGVTRNAVIGKLDRLGFGRNRPSPPPTKLAAPKPVKPPKAAKPVLWKPPVEPKPAKVKVSGDGRFSYASVSHPVMPIAGEVAQSEPKLWTERLSGECCWVVSGEGADSMACCAPVDPESHFGWCLTHQRAGTQRQTTSRRSTVADLERLLRRYR